MNESASTDSLSLPLAPPWPAAGIDGISSWNCKCLDGIRGSEECQHREARVALVANENGIV